MLRSKRFWLNAVSLGLYAGKAFGFDVPAPPSDAVIVLNLVLTILRTKFGI